MNIPTPIPEEYLAYDYGFSGVDAPGDPTTAPVVTHTPVVDTETSNKIDALSAQVENLSKLMYRLEERGDENASEAELRDKIRQLEAIIVPLLNNLLKTADKEYIFWPDRRPVVERQLEKVLSITRG